MAIRRHARGADASGLVASRLGLDQPEVEAALAWENARAYRKGGIP
jgi:hypothetical protein